MFEVELLEDIKSNKIGIIIKILESLKDLTQEINISITSNGISIQAMDHMHACLADILFSDRFFSKYRADRDIEIGLSLNKFIQILKSGNSINNLKIDCEDSPTCLNILFSQEDDHLNACLQLISIQSSKYDIPDLEYTGKVSLASSKLKEIRTKFSQSDYFTFEFKKNSFIVKQNNDTVNMERKFIDNGSSVSISTSDEVSLEIAQKFVNLVENDASLVNNVNIYFGKQEMPVFFETKEDDWYAKFYVAPKTNINK